MHLVGGRSKAAFGWRSNDSDLLLPILSPGSHAFDSCVCVTDLAESRNRGVLSCSAPKFREVIADTMSELELPLVPKVILPTIITSMSRAHLFNVHRHTRLSIRHKEAGLCVTCVKLRSVC